MIDFTLTAWVLAYIGVFVFNTLFFILGSIGIAKVEPTDGWAMIGPWLGWRFAVTILWVIIVTGGWIGDLAGWWL